MLVMFVSAAFRDPGDWLLWWPWELWVGLSGLSVVVVSFVANGGLAPDGKAIAMMLSASLCAASAILSASPGLVIN